MTEHQDAAFLSTLASCERDFTGLEIRAFKAGAAAIRALQGLRPHHPRGVVGNSYATLVVGYDELVAAQDAVGREHDLGGFDLQAAQDKHRAERVAHYRGMDSDEIASKWGRR